MKKSNAKRFGKEFDDKMLAHRSTLNQGQAIAFKALLAEITALDYQSVRQVRTAILRHLEEVDNT